MIENNYINDELLKQISEKLVVSITQIKAVLKLIEDGGTVPFIARYRKEVTGGLDEDQIRAIYTEWDYGQKLAQRKEDVMRLIEEKGKLTPELKEAIIKATKLAEIEDIYRPFKEKKKTRATDAKKKGLDPLAEYLLSFPKEGDVIAEATKYVTVEPTEELIPEVDYAEFITHKYDDILNDVWWPDTFEPTLSKWSTLGFKVFEQYDVSILSFEKATLKNVWLCGYVDSRIVNELDSATRFYPPRFMYDQFMGMNDLYAKYCQLLNSKEKENSPIIWYEFDRDVSVPETIGDKKTTAR